MTEIGWILLILVVIAIVIWFAVATWRYYSDIWHRMSSVTKEEAQRHKAGRDRDSRDAHRG